MAANPNCALALAAPIGRLCSLASLLFAAAAAIAAASAAASASASASASALASESASASPIGAPSLLAATPPMGWMMWARFTCAPANVSRQRLVMQIAERLADDGYARLGYQYVNIDDCWSLKSRLSGQLAWDPELFPDGIPALARYVHARAGLKLGLYGDCGLTTCAGFPGLLKSAANLSDNYMDADARTLAEWQVDSYKMDGCYVDSRQAQGECFEMGPALRRTGRDILLTCEWPFYMMYAHAEPDWSRPVQNCHTWRYYDDIEDSWQNIVNLIDYTVRHQSTMVKYHGPGHWFDPDQLVIGNFGLSRNQQEAQMAVWCMWSAPLMMSNDLRDIGPESAAILKNSKLIALDQDQLGVMGLMVASEASADDTGDIYAFVKPVLPVRMGCPSFAVAYLSTKYLGREQKVSFALRDLLREAPIVVASQHQDDLLEARVPLSGDKIAALHCLKRLAASDSSVDYSVEDLTGDKWTPTSINIRDKLELLVEPNSVRVVKLVEQI